MEGHIVGGGLQELQTRAQSQCTEPTHSPSVPSLTFLTTKRFAQGLERPLRARVKLQLCPALRNTPTDPSASK